MRLSFLDLVTNTVRRGELTALARQAVRELGLHIDQLIARERLKPTLTKDKEPATLLAALVRRAPNDPQLLPAYLRLVRLIMTDLIAPLIVNVGAPFSRIIDFCLDQLPGIPKLPDDALANGFIHEVLRLNPSGPVQFRVVGKETDLPVDDARPKPKAFENDIAVMMIAAANRDDSAFLGSADFRPNAGAPHRDPDKYLTFGGPKDSTAPANKGGWKDADGTWTSVHHCWGERIGLLLMREMLRATATLPRLRRAAGPTGETTLEFGIPYSLVARFSEGPGVAKSKRDETGKKSANNPLAKSQATKAGGKPTRRRKEAI
jgi:hypothetical protein